MKPFWVTSLFGAKSKQPIVELHYEDWSVQLDTPTARKIAHDILHAAEAADQDAFIYDFFTSQMKLKEAAAQKIFQQFRSWRKMYGDAHPIFDHRTTD